MPLEDGALTAEEMTKLKAWLEKHTKDDSKCPVCHSDTWNILSALSTMPKLFPDTGFVVGKTQYPVAVVVCDTCAHVRTFMAKPILGKIFSSEKAETEGGGAISTEAEAKNG